MTIKTNFIVANTGQCEIVLYDNISSYLKVVNKIALNQIQILDSSKIVSLDSQYSTITGNLIGVEVESSEEENFGVKISVLGPSSISIEENNPLPDSESNSGISTDLGKFTLQDEDTFGEMYKALYFTSKQFVDID